MTPPDDIAPWEQNWAAPAEPPSSRQTGAEAAPWEQDYGAPTPAAAEAAPGALGAFLHSSFRGARQALTETAQAPTAFRDRPQEQQEPDALDKLIATPISEGWSSPSWWTAQIGYGLGKSSPSLAAGIAGAGAGAAIGSAVPVIGTAAGGLGGGALGFGVGSFVQELAPSYLRARAEHLTHDQAVDRALMDSGIAGAFGAAMGLAPGVSLFGKTATKTAEGEIIKQLRRPVSEALAQIFGVQPAIGAAQQVVAGVTDKDKLPSAEELAQQYAMNVGQGLGLTGLHHLATRVLGPGEAPPGAKPGAPAPETPPDTTPPPPPPPGPSGMPPARATETIEQLAASGVTPQPTGDVSREAPVENTTPKVEVRPTTPEEAAAAVDAAVQSAADPTSPKALNERIQTAVDASKEAARAGAAAADIERAAAETEPEPSEAQKEAGNYRKGHTDFQGIPISIENARGSTRRGVGADGQPWEAQLPAHYGYIKRTEGADGDHVDAFIGPDAHAPTAYVIDQVHPEEKTFDEHKVMLGYPDRLSALNDYVRAFSDGRGRARIGDVTEMSIPELKDWLKRDTTKPAAPEREVPPWEQEHAVAPVSTPEPESDIRAQIKALLDPASTKDSVFLAPGNDAPRDLPPGVAVERRPEGTLLTTNEQKRAAFHDALAVDDALMARILGYPETKAEVVAGTQPRMVQARDAEGNVVAEAASSAERAPETAAALAPQAPGGDVVQVSPEEMQARRVAERGNQAVDERIAEQARLAAEREAVERGERGAGSPAQSFEAIARGESAPTSEKAPWEVDHGVQGAVPAGAEGARPEAVPGPEPERAPGPVRPAEEPGGARAAEADHGAVAEGRPAGGEAGAGAGLRDHDRVPGAGERAEPRDEGHAPDANVRGKDYVIEPGTLAEERSPRVKARDNVAAIELVKRIEYEGRLATREEQEALAKYVGWGGLSGAFQDSQGKMRAGFEEIGRRLKELLSDEDYKTAQRSTQYAHYTAENVIRSMWDAVRAMGFKGGLVFEPGMGVGHFLGLMPTDLAQRSKYQGIEYDGITARIAKLLYPESGVRHADFIKTPMPENHFDLVIGNPPFSDVVVKADPKYSARGFMLHDYFFAKSLDSVRPGGLLGFVTSAGTMNKLDAAARDYLAERAEFLGGVRLPSTAFKKNAGTEVTTDILFFKKRQEPIDLASEDAKGTEPFRETVARTLPDSEGGTHEGNVSRYFTDHPEQVLGREGFFDKLYRGRYAVHEEPGTDLDARLKEAMDRLPKDVMERAQTPEERAARDFAAPEKKDGSFYLKDGKLYQYTDGAGMPVARRGAGVEGGMTAAAMERVQALIPMRDALREVFRHDLAMNDENAKVARAELNKHYDAFVKKFGPINKAEFQYRRPNAIQEEAARAQAREDARAAGSPFDEGTFDATPMLDARKSLAEIARARKAAREEAKANGRPFSEGTFEPEDQPDIVLVKRPNIDPFMDDPESYRLRSIENYNDATGEASKKRVFKESILSHETEPEIKSAEDGALWALNKLGKLDLDAIAEKMGTIPARVIEELGDKIFRVPGTEETYHSADEYLSGDVVSKLEIARALAANDPSLARNVSALEAVQPAPLPPTDISMEIGMPWIPREMFERFAKDHLGLGRTRIVHDGLTGTWHVDRGFSGATEGMGQWMTNDRSAHELLAEALNRTYPRITYRDSEGKTHFDAEATQAAADKIDGIKEAFRDWAGDAERAGQLADRYNAAENRIVPRKFDGSYLTTPGVASDWRWRPHQTRVVSRIVLTGNTYMAHAVGAGKTSAMIGAGMEMRRLGLVRKPMYVVPNHMLGQFTKEFYEQYPTARIAVADERRFHTDRRKQFMANVAQDDLDAVIITHSSFGKIPISEEFQASLIQREIDKIEQSLDGLDKHQDRITVKKLENQKERLEQKLSARSKAGKDQTNTFEEMGVDFLFVDEAQEFRKLSFATKQSSLKGVDPEGSDKAWDLYTKAKYLDEQNPGRSAVLASGTPITNTMGEIYTISRYLQESELEKRGLGHFDSWASNFGDTKTELEPTAAGGYKQETRFARLVNVPELYKMVSQVMDVVTPAQLKQYVTKPVLKGGQREFHLAPLSDRQQEYLGQLAARVEAIKQRKGPPKKGDDILLSVINDGRHAAIDMRFVNPMLPSDPDSKINQLIANVHRIWKETKDQQFYDPGSGYKKPVGRGPAAQMIFANLGIGEGDSARQFSGYKWMRQELIRLGVPAKEIAFIKDYKSHIARQKLFNDVNEGKVRILIGSTQKMGTGTNAQRRLVAIHNQDPLWFPADDEQRVGRIDRQGNLNPEIQVHDYSTKGTYDAQMWGMMGRKGRFIEQFFRGDPEMRQMEDFGEASLYEQAAAISTTDPRVMELTDLKQQLETARRRASAHDREQYSMQMRVRDADDRVRWFTQRIADLGKDLQQRQETRGDKFAMTIGGKTYGKRKAAADALSAEYEQASAATKAGGKTQIGTIGGFPLILERGDKKVPDHFYLRRAFGDDQVGRLSDGPEGIIRSAEDRIAGVEDSIERAKSAISEYQQKADSLRPQLGKEFQGAAAIPELREKIRALEAEMKPPEEKPTAEAPAPEARLATDGYGEKAPDVPAGAPEQIVPGLTGYWKPTEAFSRVQNALAERVEAITRKMLPAGARLERYAAMRAERPGGEPMTVYGSMSRDPRILAQVVSWSLEKPEVAERTLRHEAIHALREAGLLRPAEWSTLVKGAEEEGWMDHYQIQKRYPMLDSDKQMEEAVAERFADWRRQEGGMLSKLPEWLRSIFYKMDLVRRRLGAAAREIMGRAATPEDIFSRVETGEVGARPVPETPKAGEARLSMPGEGPEEERPETPLQRRMADGRDVMHRAADALLDVWHGVQMALAPMTRGAPEAQAAAKDFANAMRQARYEMSQRIDWLTKNFAPDRLREMWDALDEESDFALKGEKPPPGRGLDRLEGKERKVVEELSETARQTFEAAQKRNMVKSEGIPWYAPRMFVRAFGGESKAVGGRRGTTTGLDKVGSNLKTTTDQLRHRKYGTAEESEAAAQTKLGEDVALVHDIRTLALATGHLQEALAGKALIDKIAEVGRMAGEETVHEGGVPAGDGRRWFTLQDHPSFNVWRPKLKQREEGTQGPQGGKYEPVKDKDGNIVFEKVPLYVRDDFEGPLRAVLSRSSSAVVNALMNLKGKAMSMIMYSPMIHLGVEFGRAFPAMPGKILTIKFWRDGLAAMRDPETMGEAIKNGLVPIGHWFGFQDISSVMNEPNIAPGRSWTAKLLGAVPGLFDPKAGDAVKRAVDKAGDFWHNTLLWDRVQQLQMGLYTNLRQKFIDKGADPQSASRAAAHLANRYAGALPLEAMSTGARQFANFLFFSRTFTLGNLGAMKDAIKGLPQDVQAQITRDAGAMINKQVKSMAARKALATVALDIALFHIGNAALQSAIAVLSGNTSPQDEAYGYIRRLGHLMTTAKENPLDLFNPYADVTKAMPQGENEPSKQDRVLVGYAADGTAIYMKNPLGKIGEEFEGWQTGPLDMLRRKMGTISRPLEQVIANDKGFGQKVYNPYAETPVEWAKNMARITSLFLGDQVPLQSVQAAWDMLNGRGNVGVEALQTFGPLAGMTFSKGAPGGPAVGELFRARDKHDFEVQQAMPGVRRSIQDGDIQSATATMQKLGISPGLQRYYIFTTMNPRARITKRQLEDFKRYATPEEAEAMDRFQSIHGEP